MLVVVAVLVLERGLAQGVIVHSSSSAELAEFFPFRRHRRPGESRHHSGGEKRVVQFIDRLLLGVATAAGGEEYDDPGNGQHRNRSDNADDSREG